LGIYPIDLKAYLFHWEMFQNLLVALTVGQGLMLCYLSSYLQISTQHVCTSKS